MLHKFCIAKHDPCNSRWRLSVQELELSNCVIKKNKERTKENQTRMLENLLTGYGKNLNSNVRPLLFLNYKRYTTGFL